MSQGLGILALLAAGVAVFATRKASASEPDAEVVDASKWGRFDSAFQAAAAPYSYPWTWLKAICLCETLLGTDAYYLNHQQGSSDGKSWGLMQVTLSTGSDLAGYALTPEDLRNDGFSIELAAKYIGELYVDFDGDRRNTIMSYNQGPGNTRKGVTAAASYYDRWTRWLEKVESGKAYL